MQTHGGQAAADAITARERYFRERILVDWSNDGQFAHALSDITEYVDAVQVESSLASSLPSDLMLIEGASAGRMDITLTGHYDGLPLAAQFAPYNGRSVFYADGITEGAAVTYDIGVDTPTGTVWYRQFTGVVQTAAADRKRNEVTLACLDNVEKFRATLDLRAAGIKVQDVFYGHRKGGLMNSAGIIDMAARANGFSAGTLPGSVHGYASTVFSAPFHGTQVPEVGYSDNIQSIPYVDVFDPPYDKQWAENGPFGQLCLNALDPFWADMGPSYNDGRWDKAYWVDENTQVGWGTPYLQIVISAWVYFKGQGQANDAPVVDVHSEGLGFLMYVKDNGAVYPAYYSGDGFFVEGTQTSGVGEPLAVGWNYIECQFANIPTAWDTAKSGVWTRCKCGTSLDSLSDTGWARIADQDDGVGGDVLSGLVRVTPFYALSDVEVLGCYLSHPIGNIDKDVTVYDNAQLSTGQNCLAYTFNQVGQEGWQLAKDVAAAEFGAVFFDEQGRFTFWTQQDVLDRQATVVRDFTLDDVSGLGMRTTTNAVRNVWNLTATDGTYDWATCYDYSSDGPLLQAAGGKGDPSATLPMMPSDMVLAVDQHTYWYAQGQENLISPEPWDQGDLAAPSSYGSPGGTEWNSDIPLHGKIDYYADTTANVTAGDHDPNGHETQQKWMGHGYWKIGVWNGFADTGIKFTDSNDQKYFRVRGTMIQQEDAAKWTITDEDSVATYGPRAIDPGQSFWRQDYDSVNALVQSLMGRFTQPVPVTDDITVPGDPRVQLGDAIAVHDPNGMGETIRLQILGVNRGRRPGQGLQDTYSVEVIRPPRVGVWDDPQYGLYDQSFIWGE